MNNTSRNGQTARHHAGVAATFALLAAIPACGNLDETDSDPPSVRALALWDSSQLVAVRTYHKEPILVDLQTGRTTGKLISGKYYNDVEPLGDGGFIGLHNQSIDFVLSDGQIDESRSIPGDLLTSMRISTDRSTLAYAKAVDPTTNSIAIVDLPSGNERFSPPGVTFSLPDSLSLSRDGTLVAFAQGDVTVARTHAPDPTAPDVPAATTCALAYFPPQSGGPVATAFSPVRDQLAVSTAGGGLNIFDLSSYPDCHLLRNIPASSPFLGPFVLQISHMQFSPTDPVLAMSVEGASASQTGVVTTMAGVIRVIETVSGGTLIELPVYRWEMASDPRSSGPLITDLQWSPAGDRITVSTTQGPVQQWDVATGTLLWSARL